MCLIFGWHPDDVGMLTWRQFLRYTEFAEAVFKNRLDGGRL